MTLNIISAVTKNNTIGLDNGLPWRLPDDWSRLLTMIKDKDVVMGRKTFESHESVLSDRKNYIFSHQDSLDLPENCIHVKDVHSFLEQAEGDVFILGGGEIYDMMLPYCNRLHLTLIEAEIEGDTKFPDFNPDEWILETSIYHPQDDKHAHGFYFNSYIRK